MNTRHSALIISNSTEQQQHRSIIHIIFIAAFIMHYTCGVPNSPKYFFLTCGPKGDSLNGLNKKIYGYKYNVRFPSCEWHQFAEFKLPTKYIVPVYNDPIVNPLIFGIERSTIIIESITRLTLQLSNLFLFKYHQLGFVLFC